MPATLPHPAAQRGMLRDWTYNDYLKLDDDTRYEIINGELLLAPAPSLGHQRVSRDLQYPFIRFTMKHKIGEVLNAPVDVILSPRVIVQPDLVFIHKDRADICKERGVFGAPDIIVEIISPSSIARDRHSKMKLYRKYEVKEYWLVDPANRSVEALRLNDAGGYDLHSSAVGRGRVESAVLHGLRVNIQSIFSTE